MRVSVLLAALVASVLCFACAGVSAMRSYDGYSVLRVDQSALDRNQRHALKHVADDKSLKIDRWAANDLMVPPATLLQVEAYLRTHHLPYSVMMADVGAEIFRERIQKISHQNQHGLDVTKYADPNAFFTAYHSLADINTYCEGLVSQFPSLVTQKQIGTSYGGVPIYVYVVSGKGANKPAIYLEGGIHAREWIAHATVTYMLSALVNGYGQDTHITTLLDNLEYHIVPVLNVDGYLYTYSTDRMWRKTTKPNPGSSCIGTDPNRNWDNHWCLPGVGGSTDPCDDSFCGSGPFSEKCVAAAADYALANANIVAFVDFHSYSQMWMTPYGYTSNLPANNDAQTAMSQQAVAALTAVNGTQYQEGPIYSTVYPAAGSSADWAYDNTTHVKFSFGVELRDTGAEGFLLDAGQIIPSGQETLAAVLAMGDYLLKNPESIKAPKAHEHAAAAATKTKAKSTTLRFGNMHQFSPRSAAPAAKAKAQPKPKQHHQRKQVRKQK